VTDQAPHDRTIPPSPAAERNAWNNIPSRETIASDKQRGRQVAVITAALILIGAAVVAVLVLGGALPGVMRL